MIFWGESKKLVLFQGTAKVPGLLNSDHKTACQCGLIDPTVFLVTANCQAFIPVGGLGKWCGSEKYWRRGKWVSEGVGGERRAAKTDDS